MTMRDHQGTTTRAGGSHADGNVSNDPAKLAEALRISEQRLRLALDAAQMGLWDVDLLSGSRSESPTMGPLFGRQVGEVNYDIESWRRHIHPDDVDRINQELDEALQGLRDYRFQYRVIGVDGVTRWIESRGRVVRDAEGRPQRIVGVAADITDSRRAAAEREQLLLAEQEARRLAETASKSKDQFLAVLSHELRTPLTPVLTMAQMLEADASLPPSVREVAATIRRNVELEARLIDDLLDLTRIGRGKLLLHLADVDLHEKIRNVANICFADVRSGQIDLVLDLKATHHFARADGARLQQILWNLLKNAIKFTPPGGKITVSTEDEPGGIVVVRVRDTGIGIPPEKLKIIFQPFEQGDLTTTRLFGGLGLGLTISKALAEVHGGELVAHSDGQNKGATFTIRIPTLIAPMLPPATAHIAPRSYADPRRRRILLVEDHADTGVALQRLLGKFGYDVHIATTVASALQIAQAEPMDLLISDLGLPDGTGHDLMRQMLTKFSIRGIALSGYGMEEDVRKSRQAGFVEHLTKPVDLDRLRSVIERVMNEATDVVLPAKVSG